MSDCIYPLINLIILLYDLLLKSNDMKAFTGFNVADLHLANIKVPFHQNVTVFISI